MTASVLPTAAPIVAPADKTVVATDPADEVVAISIIHGGFEHAEFPLIVGSFEGEHLSSAERFLDRQFEGWLSSRLEIGRYPAAIGESLFISSPESEPPGAYVVGLGSSAKLGRSELAATISRGLVDRCVELYPHRDTGDQVIEVGVSSTLAGVRHGEALRVEDAVVGIVEGVLGANEALAKFEAARPSGRTRVRVTALQFLERYADRCDLAAAALRSMATSIALDTRYRSLSDIVVEVRSGGRPAGAELVENSQRSRRFLITKRPDDTVTTDARTLHLDVAVMGGSARADRVHHRLDRTMVDALLTKLATDSRDAQTAATLYDQLVPHELREQFLTSAAVHFIVDSTTANYPWELVTVPRPTGHQVIAAAGGIIRQFSETEVRGWGGRLATTGGALVIGAGGVPGYPALTGVYTEVHKVAELLGGVFAGQVEVLSDESGPLDLVAVQNQLFTDHRILHIAGHGVYEDGRPESTGAVLTAEGLLTVDTIRQLQQVPELVFLNCCSLGRIGDSRLAAGLAREFMACGVRAVIAAGWPVTDQAALEFANVFYKSFLGGMAFGDSVAKARLMCDRADDSRTWAAYQCYGDPAYLLRGATPDGAAALSNPVSESDLISRLEALATRISDYGRPGMLGSDGTRRRLLQSWEHLERWAAAQRALSRQATVDRLLTTTLRDLGELNRAATRYLRHVSFDTRPGSSGVQISSTMSPADLLDAAECLGRHSQLVARTVNGKEVLKTSAVMTGFDRAERLARTAASLVPSDVSRGVLGDVLIRRATVDSEHRRDLIAEAMRVYQQRDGGASFDYRLEHVAQLAAMDEVASASRIRASRVADRVRAARAAEAAKLKREEGHRWVDQRPGHAGDFESRVQLGDSALTIFMEGSHQAEYTSRASDVVHLYQSAFCARSTWSQRRRTIEHIVDLQDLLGVDDERRQHLAGIVAALLQWEVVNTDDHDLPEAPESLPVELLPAGEVEPDRARITETVVLRAFAAARGECLLIEYQTPGGNRYRLLVDGGLGAAYEEGLGAHIAAQPDKHLKVDTAVITHIDLDHIEGAIDAIRNGHLTADDVWFNGLGEISVSERGPRQGDELSALVPKEKRNQCVGGEAIFVPEAGSLTSLPLDGGASCVVLAPSRDRLRTLEKKWKSPLRSEADADPILALCDHLNDDEEPEDLRGAAPFGGDRSVANGSSLALLFEFRGVSLLLTGDAFASDLEASIRRLLAERKIARLPVDVLKLSHHGSRGNLTPDLLEMIEPKAVLVCTDGSMFSHPDVEALAEVRRCYPTVPILFTDATDLIAERAATVGGVLPTEQPLRLSFSSPI